MQDLSLESRFELYRTFWDAHARTVEALARDLREVFDRGGRLFVAGNGGSAAQADHLVAELVGRFRKKRNALPAILLGAGMSTLTALSNDFGYAEALALELEALARPGDALMVLTTSGRSANILRLLEAGRTIPVFTIALTGAGGKDLPVDRRVVVPTTSTPLVQEVHLQVLHTLAGLLEGES